MPDRQYIARNEPPSVGDRAAAHAVELVLAVGSFMLGTSLLADSFIHSCEDTHPIMWVASPWLALAIGLWMTFGTFSVFVGILWPGGWGLHGRWKAKLDKKWTIERVGWALTSSAWACYSLAVLTGYPLSSIGWGLPLTLAAAGVARLWLLRAVESSTRDSIKRFRRRGKARG